MTGWLSHTFQYQKTDNRQTAPLQLHVALLLSQFPLILHSSDSPLIIHHAQQKRFANCKHKKSIMQINDCEPQRQITHALYPVCLVVRDIHHTVTLKALLQYYYFTQQ
jgi:hypothetical protein